MVYIAKNSGPAEEISKAMGSGSKKTFFQLLSGKNALIVGVVTGAMVFSSIGFIVLVSIYLKGN